MTIKATVQNLETIASSGKSRARILSFLGACALATAYFLGQQSVWTLSILTLIATLLALISFQWIYQKTKVLHEKGLLSRLRIFFHLVVGFVAVIPARFAVATALGLPPQDFELTVHTLAVLLYIPIWLLMASSILTLVTILHGIHFLLLHCMTMLFPVLPVFPTKKPNAFQRWMTKKSEESQRSYILFMGTMILAVSMAFLYQTISNLIVNQTIFTKCIAYYTDYQAIPNYPCFSKDQRVRLHENGVVSIATQTDAGIEIQVKTIDIAECLAEHRQP